MEWIIKALKVNGKAFIIVPSGTFDRIYDKNLRQFILDTCYIDAIISLPLRTFFTTTKKTYILAITKKNEISQVQTDPVFTYLCNEIGESRDINRFDIEQDDLSEAVNLFKFFKGNKSKFDKLHCDNRCKIKNINYFIKNIDNWIIEENWTEKEQIALGVIENNKPITILEFTSILEAFSETIKTNKNNIISFCKTEYKSIEIKMEELFNIEKGDSKYTKKHMNNNKGNYPVYSSQTTNKGIIANINSFDYNCKCLTWTTDGTYVGTVFIRNGKFSMTTHCGGLFLKEKYQNVVLIEYLHSILNSILPSYKDGQDSNKRLGISKIKNIKIKIPVTSTGEFDLQKQKEIAEKYQKIEKIKSNIKLELQKIENIKVDIGL